MVGSVVRKVETVAEAEENATTEITLLVRANGNHQSKARRSEKLRKRSIAPASYAVGQRVPTRIPQASMKNGKRILVHFRWQKHTLI